MRPRSDARSNLLWPIPLLSAMLIVLSACSDGGQTSASRAGEPDDTLPGILDRVDLLGIPTIYSIGESSILTFEPGKPLEIKILGNDLHDGDLSWNIAVNGIAPLQAGADYELREQGLVLDRHKGDISDGEDNLSLVLTKEYVSRIKSGDPLSVTAQIANNRLTRRFAEIRESDQVIEQQVKALGDLRIHRLQWLVEGQAALAAEQSSPEGVQAEVRIRAAQALKPVVEGLLRIREVTYRSREVNRQVISGLQGFDPLADRADARLQELVDQLLELRGVMRTFQRNNVAYAPVVSSASRRFVLFSAEDYRQKFLGSTIPLNEINAFPMPNEQVQKIFGPLVAKEFFVVALSMSNSSEDDRLVNTGMIKASGRALIVPGPNSALGGPALNFTIPIEVAPQSTEQVYTMVSDSKPHETREWVFRSLEFTGGLATATAIGFNANLDLIKAVGLFSGVVIPGAKALWPDDVQGYMRNVIAFGMPDLVKINGKSSFGHRVLFFSKEKLQLMVSDPLQFQTRNSPDGRTAEIEHPDQFIIQLAFDSLMVTYDNITSPTKGTVEERLADARRAADAQVADLRQIAQSWTGTPGDLYARQLRFEDWAELRQWLDLLASAGPATTLPAEARDQAVATLAAWRQLHGLLGPATIKANLTNHETFGLAALERLAQDLDNAQGAVASGNSAQMYQSRLANAEGAVKRAGDLVAFHRQVAVQLREIHLAGHLGHLGKGNDQTTARVAADDLAVRLQRILEAAKPVQDLLPLPQPGAKP